MDTQKQQLSANFTREEFELEGPMPESSVPAFEFLANRILEQIRLQFSEPMEITSGHRSEAGNAEANGNPHSEHVSTPDYCAADWTMPRFKADMRGVFDWIRLSSGLPFHIVVLEHGKSGDVIHTSWHRDASSRVAKEGSTHNASPYIEWAIG
jgi:hypothetical protein